MLSSLALALGLMQGQPMVQSASLSVGISLSNSQRVASDGEYAGDFQSFVEALVRDLPAYANRAIQRSRRSVSDRLLPSIITAGQLELEPLPLPPDAMIPEEARQVFVTTLERTYEPEGIVDVQVYHWIFLVKTDNRWRLVVMFSVPQFNDGDRPVTSLTSLQESTDGAIAEAIRTWLRDRQWNLETQN